MARRPPSACVPGGRSGFGYRPSKCSMSMPTRTAFMAILRPSACLALAPCLALVRRVDSSPCPSGRKATLSDRGAAYIGFAARVTHPACRHSPCSIIRHHRRPREGSIRASPSAPDCGRSVDGDTARAQAALQEGSRARADAHTPRGSREHRRLPGGEPMVASPGTTMSSRPAAGSSEPSIVTSSRGEGCSDPWSCQHPQPRDLLQIEAGAGGKAGPANPAMADAARRELGGRPRQPLPGRAVPCDWSRCPYVGRGVRGFGAHSGAQDAGAAVHGRGGVRLLMTTSAGPPATRPGTASAASVRLNVSAPSDSRRRTRGSRRRRAAPRPRHRPSTSPRTPKARPGRAVRVASVRRPRSGETCSRKRGHRSPATGGSAVHADSHDCPASFSTCCLSNSAEEGREAHRPLVLATAARGTTALAKQRRQSLRRSDMATTTSANVAAHDEKHRQHDAPGPMAPASHAGPTFISTDRDTVADPTVVTSSSLTRRTIDQSGAVIAAPPNQRPSDRP